MPLLSPSINWKKLLASASEDQRLLANALSAISADLADLDLRLEGGSNDMNQNPAISLQEDTGAPTLNGLSVTRQNPINIVDSDGATLSTFGNGQIVLPASLPSNVYFSASIGGSAGAMTFTTVVDTAGGFNSGTGVYTLPSSGTFLAVCSVRCITAGGSADATVLGGSGTVVTINHAALSFNGTANFTNAGGSTTSFGYANLSNFSSSTSQDGKVTCDFSQLKLVTSGQTIGINDDATNGSSAQLGATTDTKLYNYSGSFYGYYL